MKKIITFSASNSKNSINRTLLEIAGKKITGHNVTSVDIRDYSLPFYSVDTEEREGIPEIAMQLKSLFTENDAFIFSIPEHNGGSPAVFKNLIDWLSRIGEQSDSTFAGKPVLLLSTSPGANGGATNLASLTQLLPWQGAKIINSFSLGSFYDTVVDGKLLAEQDEQLKSVISDFLISLQVAELV